MKFKILLSLLSIILIFSCKKNPEVITDNTVVSIPIPAATAVTGSVAGSVVDENNNAVANAQVTVSGTVYTTDRKGFFNTTNLTLDQYISTVTVNKTGYFKAIRSFAANATKNYVSIKLIPKTLTGSFTSSTAGSVSLLNSSQISFASNSINIKSTGAAYSGTVNVYASYIDPTGSDIGARIPGSFIGEDATQIYYLQSAGMIAVELESSTGESLQLASGKPAIIKLAIPASLQAKVPATIDTWSLNDKGVWIKEGIATKNGTFYEMQVSHFTFWNTDIPVKTIYITLNIKDQNNHILSNVGVQLTMVNSGGWTNSYSYTDSLGNISGYVPANESLQLKLLSGSYTCSNTLYTQTIGPFTTNTNLNVTATIDPQQSLGITGNVRDCVGSAVTKGSAIIYADSHTYYTSVINGSFNFNILHCSSLPMTVQITTIDSTGQQQSTTTYTATQNTLDAGTISSCGTSTSQYINYTLDGTNYIINSTDTLTYLAGMNAYSSATLINGGQTNTSKAINLIFLGRSVGTYSLSIADTSNRVNNFRNPLISSNATGTFTIYGLVGEFIEGSFNVPFTDRATNINHTCLGTFRVRRR